MFDEELLIQHEENLVNMEIEEGDEVNDDVNEKETINDDEQRMRYAYVTE